MTRLPCLIVTGLVIVASSCSNASLPKGSHTTAASSRDTAPIVGNAQVAQASRPLSFDGSPRLQLTPGCPVVALEDWNCSTPSRLDIIDGSNGTQTLMLASLRSSWPIRTYRGALDGAYAADPYTFVLGDINFDQRVDLLVWTGNAGTYGHKSFDVYLQRSGKAGFVRSSALSQLGIGRSPPVARGAHLWTGAKSGCCVHVEETYRLVQDMPLLVKRRTTDTSDITKSPQITTEDFGKGIHPLNADSTQGANHDD